MNDFIFCLLLVMGNFAYTIKKAIMHIYYNIKFYKHNRTIKTYLTKLKERKVNEILN
jgi:hypothetical protein